MKSKAVCFSLRRLARLPISPPRHFNLFIYCITHYDIILLHIYIILNNGKYRCSTLMFWFCFASNRHEENNYFLLIIFIRFALKMISARDPDKKRFHSFLSGFCFSLRSNKNIALRLGQLKNSAQALFFLTLSAQQDLTQNHGCFILLRS